MEDKSRLPWEPIKTIGLWVALPLVIGLLIASLIPQPVIGVIRVDDVIESGLAENITAQINYAREHPNIRALVLVLASPGGTVADTEALYLELAKLRMDKPIVASVGTIAASGAYYLSVGTDYIFALPTSEVGNIGVIGYLPDAPTVFETIISTGPYKLFGTPRDIYVRQIEMVKQGFFSAVTLGRGDRLTAGPEVIFTGELWPGTEALRLGLIDALGTESDALAKAAQLAHISNYRVENLETQIALEQLATASSFYKLNDKGARLPYPAEFGIYLLYIPPFNVGK